MIKTPYANLLNHEIVHLFLTFLAASIVWIYLRKKRKDTAKTTLLVALGAFIGEFLLDTDHFFEYFFAYGLSFRMDYFFGGNMFHKLQKIFVIFHAWEWLVVLGVIIYFAKNAAMKYFLIALTLGLFFHLVYDNFYNHPVALGYSIIYRYLHGFDVKSLSSPD